MMILLIELNLLIPVSVTLTIYQVETSKDCQVCPVDNEYIPLFFTSTCIQGRLMTYFLIEQTFTLAFWWTLSKGDLQTLLDHNPA